MPKVTIQHSSLNLNAVGHLGGLQLSCLISCALVCFVFSLTGCVKAPGTARDQHIFISEEKEIAMGLSAFRDVLKNARLSKDPKITLMVNRVGKRIAKVANKPEYHWEFVVIQDDDQVNAFALPGGKVAVFTGILMKTKDDTELAVVISHLVAHLLQRHGAERYSQDILEQRGTLASGTFPTKQTQESEADYVGLRLMAQAGYDPREAVGVWKRMNMAPGHAPDATRIKKIESWIPDAMQFYNPVPASSMR